MRIKFKQSKANVGDIRTVTKFLWFPKVINRELRWLEIGEWTQRYREAISPTARGDCYSPGDECVYEWVDEWVDVEWVD